LLLFEELTEGDINLFAGEPGSVRGESPENKESIFDFPCFSRRVLQRTSPAGALGVFGSRGLGGGFGSLMGGGCSIGTASGDFVSFGGVLWFSDWAGVGRLGSPALVVGCWGSKEHCTTFSTISAYPYERAESYPQLLQLTLQLRKRRLRTIVTCEVT
jgi:hypothetical protein